MKRLRQKLEEKLKTEFRSLCQGPKVMAGDNFEYHIGKGGCFVFQRTRLIMEYRLGIDDFINDYKIIHPDLVCIKKAIYDLETSRSQT